MINYKIEKVFKHKSMQSNIVCIITFSSLVDVEIRSDIPVDFSKLLQDFKTSFSSNFWYKSLKIIPKMCRL